MKVYALIGRSGTGKSFQAVNLCRELKIESIIDDGLFICRNKVVAGISAKRQPTKVGAVKTALFTKDEHMQEVKEALGRMKPSSILIIGTSVGMVEKIVKRLELPSIDRKIFIEEITTKEERAVARKQRDEMGQHVIPAPTFQLKRQFSGYFMMPMKMLLKELGPRRVYSEKSVVRPTYSYLGEYKISEKVLSDIVECVSRESSVIYDVAKVMISQVPDGIDIYMIVNLKYIDDLPGRARAFQRRTAKKIEEMTAFNVNKIDIDVKDVI